MSKKNVETSTQPSSGGGAEERHSSKLDPFVLEDVFPDVGELFKPHVVKPVTNGDVLVVLDTSAMLLPYKMSSGSLSALGDVYNQLAKQGRLFVPARAAREFAKNRNNELGNLIQNLKVRRERLSDLPPILAGMAGYQDARDRGKEVRKAYEQLENGVKAWRGDDPVTKLYESVFPKTSFIDLPNDKKSREGYLQELERCTRNLIPPGYKDASKKDDGIGDLLIWLTLLKIGSASKKDMIFVTGEEKADWFNRSSGEHVYPRYELMDEYRRVSGGGGLRLINLHQLLEEMKAPAEVVKDVRSAEKEDARRAAARAAEKVAAGFHIIKFPVGTFVVPASGISAGSQNLTLAAAGQLGQGLTAPSEGIVDPTTRWDQAPALAGLFDGDENPSKPSDKSDDDDSHR